MTARATAGRGAYQPQGAGKVAAVAAGQEAAVLAASPVGRAAVLAAASTAMRGHRM